MLDPWVVRVQSGLLSGTPEKDGKVMSFKGIPYAAPPIGKFRWRPTQPPLPWAGIRKADHFGPAAVQEPQGTFFQQEFFPEPLEMSEDCLYLNVWTPARTPDEKLPVFVWIHGGGLEWWSGSSIPFDGANLAELGVVVVTINYRLGIFGLFAHPLLSRESPYGVSGNYAILDQIAALKWVKENIRGFGGDSDVVTVGGESGGSRSIGIHLVSPLSEGLFRRAIMQSGSAVGGWALDLSLPEGEKTGVAFADLLGIRTPEELRLISAEKLQSNYKMGKFKGLRFFTYIDGYVCKDNPGRIFQDGCEQKVSILHGSTKNEGVHDYSEVTPESYVTDIRRRYGKDADAYLGCYPGKTREEAIASLGAASSDQHFIAHRAMSYFHYEATSEKIYQYIFTKVPPGRESEYYGAFHTGEIAYIFRNLDCINRPWTKGDYEFSDTVARYWTNFIKNGDPNGDGLPFWEPCTSKDSAVMLLGDETGMAAIPNAERMTFAAEYFSRWLGNRDTKLSW
jgi:para-nitrobenzyl esterase